MTRQTDTPRDWHKHSAPPTITAAELMDMEFEPTRWVIPDVLPEGLSLLVGKPKKGKSWMSLGACLDVAIGGLAFGRKWAEQGDTLYLALEDSRKRLKKVLNGAAAPNNMHLHTEWPRLDEGGAERLDEWLTEHPKARLVVIDTLAKIRNPARGQNIYTEDYAALAQLLPLAAEHGVAIVVVHHLRKMAASDPMDEISSSTGLTAGVDGFLILRRTPGSKGPTLYVDGRDIEEPTEYALIWNVNTATWTIEGEAEEVHISKERADILLTLNRHEQYMTPREVTDALGPAAKYNNVKFLMWTMLQDDQLLKDGKGRYYPTNPTNPTNPTPKSGPTVSGLAGGPEATNPTFDDTYTENDTRGSGVSGVSTVGAKVVSIESGEPYDVYVGRGKHGTKLKRSKWHNPFKMDTKDEKRDGTHEEVIEKFERHLYKPVANYQGKVFDGHHLVDEAPEIKGKTLACHCAPKKCHADILLRLANHPQPCFCEECLPL